MRRPWAIGLAVINAALVVATTSIGAAPAFASVAREEAWLDCCQHSTEGIGFCCNNCCWITQDCNVSGGCPSHPE